jgi:hypothetical protein
MRAGKARHGPLPTELQGRLFRAAARLAWKNICLQESMLGTLISQAASWDDLLTRLESLAGPHTMRRLGKSTGRLVGRIKRLFQRAEAR